MHRFAPAIPIVLLLQGCGGADTEAPSALPAAEMSLSERGRVVFKKCQTCHTLEEGGRHKVGPNLWAVFGATAGEAEGFAYSKAMRESGVVWDDASMDAYLEKPSAYMKGTRMSFVGLRKPEDREAVIAYLHERTDPPAE